MDLKENKADEHQYTQLTSHKQETLTGPIIAIPENKKEEQKGELEAKEKHSILNAKENLMLEWNDDEKELRLIFPGISIETLRKIRDLFFDLNLEDNLFAMYAWASLVQPTDNSHLVPKKVADLLKKMETIRAKWMKMKKENN